MRPFLVLLLAVVSLPACEPTPRVAAPDQPCNCAASRGEAHHASGRTQNLPLIAASPRKLRPMTLRSSRATLSLLVLSLGVVTAAACGSSESTLSTSAAGTGGTAAPASAARVAPGATFST